MTLKSLESPRRCPRCAGVFLFRRTGGVSKKAIPTGLLDGRVRLFFYGEQAALDVRLARQKAYVDALLKKNPGTDAKTLAMKNRRFKALYTRYETLKLKHDVVAFIEDKLVCEGVMAPRRRGQRTRLNQRLAEGIRRFQRRHKISDSKLMSPATVAALQKSSLELHYKAFVRAMTVRVTDAASIIEDGSVGAVQYRGQNEEQLTVPNLSARFTQRLLQAIGVTDEIELQGFYSDLTQRHLNRFMVAVRLPEKPSITARRCRCALKLIGVQFGMSFPGVQAVYVYDKKDPTCLC